MELEFFGRIPAARDNIVSLKGQSFLTVSIPPYDSIYVLHFPTCCSDWHGSGPIS
jgi:hypothetical protein